MMSVGLWIAVLLLAILLAVWITFTLTRLDRLHARVDAAYAALDAQLVRRAAALLQGAESIDRNSPAAPAIPGLVAIAAEALHAGPEGREGVENRVGRSITELSGHAELVSRPARVELHEASLRLIIARRFYNGAVRDTRDLRERRMPRILHLAGHRDLPRFFDIDDAVSFPVEPPPGSWPQQDSFPQPPPVISAEDAP